MTLLHIIEEFPLSCRKLYKNIGKQRGVLSRTFDIGLQKSIRNNGKYKEQIRFALLI